MVKRALIVILVLIAVSLGVSSLLGYRPFILRSSSMEPSYSNGSLIFADTRVSLDSLSPGDAIVYQGFTQELTRYQGNSLVKPDNSSATVEITADQVIGRVVFSIPWVGNVVNVFLQHQYLAWIIVVVLFVGALLPRTTLACLLPLLQHTEKVEQDETAESAEKPEKKGDTL